MNKIFAALFFLCSFILAQNIAQLTLRDGQVITLEQDKPQNMTIARGINAPSGPLPLHLNLTTDELDIVNGGICDPYNQPGTGQPLYIRSLVLRAPGKTIWQGRNLGARNVAGDDWIIVWPTDPKNPARVQQLGGTSPYAASTTEAFLDGGEGINVLLTYLGDQLDTVRMPDAAKRAQIEKLIVINRPALQQYPFLNKMVDIHRYDDTTEDSHILRGQTLATWLIIPENIAPLGGGGPYSIRPGFYGPDIGRTWYVNATELIANGSGGLLHQYDNDGLYYLMYYLLHPDTDEGKLSFMIGRTIARRAVSRVWIRSDQPHPLKDAQRNEETAYSGPNIPPRDLYQIHKQGSGSSTTPYESKWWIASQMGYALACDYDLLLRGAATRAVVFWANRNTLFPPTGETRMASQSLQNMGLAYSYAKLVGDDVNATKIKQRAANLIENAAVQAGATGTMPHWLPATNNPALGPFHGASGLQGPGEGCLAHMAHWIEDEGVATNRLQWIKDCSVWWMNNLTRPAGTSNAGHPMREASYYWTPTTTVGHWNDPPATAAWQGQQEWSILELGDRMEKWFPGTYTAQWDALKAHTFEHPQYTVQNTGAITEGPYNYSSGPKWKNLWLRYSWKWGWQ